MEENNEKMMKTKKEDPEKFLNANENFFLRDYPNQIHKLRHSLFFSRML